MSKVQIRLREARCPGYAVEVQPGLIHRVGEILRPRFSARRILVLSNPRVFGLLGRALEASLRRGGFGRPSWHLVPDGERYKTFDQARRALIALAAWDRGLEAKPLVLLLGGGVIGDLGGFAAATYK
ncbi:MAG: 3-dehydroquinate synthase, partial [bacterium]